jgi:hypothetical protein
MSEPGGIDLGATRPVFRVYYVPEPLREAIRTRRTALGLPVARFVAESVAHELGPLVRALGELGLSGRPGEGVRPVRLPLSEESLGDLRRAGDQVGLPASRLLLLCLARAAARKRRRPGPRVAVPAGPAASARNGVGGPGRPRRKRTAPVPVAEPPAETDTQGG